MTVSHGLLAAWALTFLAACASGPSSKAITSPTASPSANIAVGTSDPWILYHWPRDTGTSQIDALWLVRPDGSGLHLLVPSLATTPLDGADWSPDGQRIAFIAERKDRSDLWVVNADSTGARRLVACDEPCNTINLPAWSHDGRRIMFGQDNLPAGPGGVPTRFDFRVFDVASGTVTTLFSEPIGSPAEQARWSPDGTQIVFRRARLSDAGDEIGGAVFVSDLGGRNQRQLTAWSTFAGGPDWGPDGRIAFDEPEPGQISQARNLYLVRPDGGGLTALTHFAGGVAGASWPHWTPDGSAILFRQERCMDGAQLDLCLGVPGSDIIQLATIKPDGTGLGLAPPNGVNGGHAELRPIP